MEVELGESRASSVRICEHPSLWHSDDLVQPSIAAGASSTRRVSCGLIHFGGPDGHDAQRQLRLAGAEVGRP
jgi:hypothetical protein